MNLVEMANKFGAILKVYRLEKVDDKLINVIASLAGVKLNDQASMLIADFLSRAKDEYKLTSVADIFKSGELSGALQELISILPSLGSDSTPSDSKPKVNANGVPSHVDVDSVLLCHHCKKRIHVRECVELKLSSQK